jgi:hypothetical protein
LLACAEGAGVLVALSVALGANPGQKAVEKQTFAKAMKASLSSSPIESAKAVTAAMDTLAEQPVLSGLVRLMGQRGSEGLATNLFNIMADTPSSFVPTLANQVRQMLDNAKRETRTNSVWQTSANRVLNKVPGASETLPQAYDTLGRAKEVFKGEGNDAISVFLNPAFVDEFAPLIQEQIIQRSYEQSGNPGVFPPTVSRTINIPVMKGGRQDRVPVELTNEEYAELQKRTGAIVRNYVKRIPDDASPEVQEKLILKILQLGGLVGKTAIMPGVIQRVSPQMQEEGIRVLQRR